MSSVRYGTRLGDLEENWFPFVNLGQFPRMRFWGKISCQEIELQLFEVFDSGRLSNAM